MLDMLEIMYTKIKNNAEKSLRASEAPNDARHVAGLVMEGLATSYLETIEEFKVEAMKEHQRQKDQANHLLEMVQDTIRRKSN